MGMRTLLLAVFLFAHIALAENWPQWRGPRLDGTSAETGLPVKWSKTENLAWTLPLPARSGSTPIIWNNHVFLNVAAEGKIWLWAVDRRTGSVLWQKHLSDGDRMQRKHNMSSPSPVTDGQWVWVLTGTGILKAFDFTGQEKWARDIPKEYGPFGLNHGYGSSPLLDGDHIYVQVLHGMHTDDPSYILKLDKKTGKTLWRSERPTDAKMESPDSYTTPLIASFDGKRELIIAGGDYVTGHDLATGKELWRGGGFNPQNNPFNRIIASPVIRGSVVYTPTRVRPFIAYRAGGAGDVTKTHQFWQFQNGPDVPTPTLDDKYLYSVNDRGVVYCVELETGKEVYGGQRLRPGTYSASPTLADGKIYVTSEEGVTSIFRAGPKFELIAENETGEYVLSTISVSQGNLYLRTDKALYVIGKKPQ
jgi:outer membrane protein assembly factor BamB